MRCSFVGSMLRYVLRERYACLFLVSGLCTMPHHPLLWDPPPASAPPACPARMQRNMLPTKLHLCPSSLPQGGPCWSHACASFIVPMSIYQLYYTSSPTNSHCRDELCFFIDENFDGYVERMRYPHCWGGEALLPSALMHGEASKQRLVVVLLSAPRAHLPLPNHVHATLSSQCALFTIIVGEPELAVATHVLHRPIAVFTQVGSDIAWRASWGRREAATRPLSFYSFPLLVSSVHIRGTCDRISTRCTM